MKFRVMTVLLIVVLMAITVQGAVMAQEEDIEIIGTIVQNVYDGVFEDNGDETYTLSFTQGEYFALFAMSDGDILTNLYPNNAFSGGWVYAETNAGPLAAAAVLELPGEELTVIFVISAPEYTDGEDEDTLSFTVSDVDYWVPEDSDIDLSKFELNGYAFDLATLYVILESEFAALLDEGTIAWFEDNRTGTGSQCLFPCG